MIQHFSKRHNTFFVCGIICLILSMGLLLFALYLLPFFIFGWVYNVPGIITISLAYLHDAGYGSAWSGFLAWCLFAVPGLIFGVLAYSLNRKLDQEL